jgi:hypothetical protein
MFFTLFERFRKGFGDGLATYRDGFGADVPLSGRRKNQIPYICPYLGFSFGSASPILVLMTAISLIAYHLASHPLETKLRVDRVAPIRSGRRLFLCSDPRPKLSDFAKLTAGGGLNVGQVCAAKQAAGLCEVDFGALLPSIARAIFRGVSPWLKCEVGSPVERTDSSPDVGHYRHLNVTSVRREHQPKILLRGPESFRTHHLN